MSLPTLDNAQIEWIVQQVGAYIEDQRETYRPGAVPLGLSQKNAMRPFFPEPDLRHQPGRLAIPVLACVSKCSPQFLGKNASVQNLRKKLTLPY